MSERTPVERTSALLKKRGGDRGRRVFRNYYKGHMDKPRGRVDASKGGGIGWCGGGYGEKMQTTVIEQQ